MRAHACFAAAVLLACSGGCASPLAAVPVARALAPAAVKTLAPQVLAAPMEDGSVYVLAEGGPTSSKLQLRSLWKKQAAEACEGDYMVMSERDSVSRHAGQIGGRSYEGFVRCVSPEAMADWNL